MAKYNINAPKWFEAQNLRDYHSKMLLNEGFWNWSNFILPYSVSWYSPTVYIPLDVSYVILLQNNFLKQGIRSKKKP